MGVLVWEKVNWCLSMFIELGINICMCFGCYWSMIFKISFLDGYKLYINILYI